MYKLQLKDNPDRGIWLVGEKIRLGAGRDNDLVLEGLGIAQYHAHILIDNDKVKLRNLSSGCYVNDHAVYGEYQLHESDEIRIGQQRLIVLDSQKAIEEPTLAPQSAIPRAPIKRMVVTGWSLVANHPQLKDQNYSIGKKATLGRGKECEFPVPYKLLSREHATFTVDENGLLLTDLGSANGTFVNGKRIKQAWLRGGEKVSFAKLTFTVKPPPGIDSTQKKAADELKKTMLRPALSMDVVLKHMANKKHDANMALMMETDRQLSMEATPARGYSRWWVMATLVMVVALGSWWLLPF